MASLNEGAPRTNTTEDAAETLGKTAVLFEFPVYSEEAAGTHQIPFGD